TLTKSLVVVNVRNPFAETILRCRNLHRLTSQSHGGCRRRNLFKVRLNLAQRILINKRDELRIAQVAVVGPSPVQIPQAVAEEIQLELDSAGAIGIAALLKDDRPPVLVCVQCET